MLFKTALIVAKFYVIIFWNIPIQGQYPVSR